MDKEQVIKKYFCKDNKENMQLQKSKITVIDSICGKGKTSYAIQEICKGNIDKFIYVTPYLKEVNRVMSACEQNNIKVYEPKVSGGKNKLNNFMNLIKKGHNVVLTHSLFDNMSLEGLEYINQYGYTLILDEVHEVIRRIKLDIYDRETLVERKMIEIDPITNQVIWTGKKYDPTIFDHFRTMCELGSVYLYGNTFYFYCFPIQVFTRMKNVYVLTYLFRGQLQYSYYEHFNVSFDYKDVEFNKKTKEYYLTEIDEEQRKEDLRKSISLVNLYQGKFNYTKGITLTSSWFEKVKKEDDENEEDENYISSLELLQRNIYNYFKCVCKSKSKDNMWTCLKEYKKRLKGEGYTKGFVELNARATNEYADKSCLVYMYNRYMIPVYKNFFTERGVEVNEDLYALSELLQWVFRSRIRVGEPINLYLPSQRMREIFMNWEELIKIK